MPRKSISDMIPDITEPEVPTEPAATPPPAPPNGTVPAPERAVAAPVAPSPVPDLDEDMLVRWRRNLDQAALQVASTRKKSDAATRAWDRLVADAVAAGVPGNLIVAAAATADVETPALGDVPG
jgi:hypothetical protein